MNDPFEQIANVAGSDFKVRRIDSYLHNGEVEYEIGEYVPYEGGVIYLTRSQMLRLAQEIFLAEVVTLTLERLEERLK